jgi:hypothetical protein
MKWINTDGGRADAGYKGEAGDCAARAIAIATHLSYQEAYDLLNVEGKAEKPSKRRRGKSTARSGVYSITMRKVMSDLGWEWTPTMKVGQGCRVHLRSDELPMGKIIVRLSKHYAAVIDGVLHDTHDCSRDGTRCVYGYWQRPA